MAVAGLHHVTAIASSAQATADFCVRVLGLTLVKRTVNFDDPTSHHLYFGDASGTPGTLVTYFAGARIRRGGKPGAGMASSIALAVPADSLARWRPRLRRLGVPFADAPGRFGDRALALDDPDGIRIELVEHPVRAREIWPLGLHAVSLTLTQATPTLALLDRGFLMTASEDGGAIVRASGEAALGAHVDVLAAPAAAAGRMAAGAIHHVAFRARDEEHHAALRSAVEREGLAPGETLDRRYFRSFYFREPGGVLFEVATDAPGFAADEPDGLGRALCLPPWLESERTAIAAALPPFSAPAGPAPGM
ncbi:MAG: VOC family protein [Candidatus Eisenbacteria bacterium]